MEQGCLKTSSGGPHHGLLLDIWDAITSMHQSAPILIANWHQCLRCHRHLTAICALHLRYPRAVRTGRVTLPQYPTQQAAGCGFLPRLLGLSWQAVAPKAWTTAMGEQRHHAMTRGVALDENAGRGVDHGFFAPYWTTVGWTRRARPTPSAISARATTHDWPFAIPELAAIQCRLPLKLARED